MGCCGNETRVESANINGHEIPPPAVDEDSEWPRKNRGCTDIIMLMIFIAFCIGGAIYLGVAYSKGDVNRIIRGHDKYGNICGVQNEQYFNNSKSGKDFTNRPYFNSVDKECVSACGANRTRVGYYCIPFSTSALDDYTPLDEGKQFFNDVGEDIQKSWQYILAIFFVGLGLSIVMIIMLRFLAAIVVWITVAIIILGSIAGTIYLWVLWHLKNTDDVDDGAETKFLVAAIFATIGTVLLLVLLIAMRKRIKLVIVLFKEAGKAVAAIPFVIFMPLLTMIVMALVLLGIIGGMVIISAAGDPTEKTEGGEIYFKRIPLIEWLRLYHIFGFFWVTQFVIGCQHVVVATAVSTWYFTRNKSQLGWPIFVGVQNLVLYHMGSVAFGALLIAIVKMIRYLLKQVQKRVTPQSPLGCLLKCCQCCLACFEKFLKYITRNAYIEIAIFGCNFCSAAQKAFNIITANAFRVTAINMVGDFVLLLAKIAVMIATGFIGYEIIRVQQGIKYEFVPLVVALVCVAITVHCFVSIYEMTIDTLFVCFCEDCAMNDGIQKPYFMSRSLMKFVENSKKALEQLDSAENAKKNGDPYGGMAVQQVGPYQVGASVLPSQMATPVHHPGGVGMSPLHPAYKATSIPPSPSHFFRNGS